MNGTPGAGWHWSVAGVGTNHPYWSSLVILPMALPVPTQVAADQWSAAQPITIVLIDNQFQPDHLTFRAGQPYQLRLENHGKDLHEFTAPAFLRSATIRDPSMLANGGTDIVVQSGKSVQVFLIPHATGRYDLTCADHDWDGMTGSITVE